MKDHKMWVCIIHKVLFDVGYESKLSVFSLFTNPIDYINAVKSW